MQHGVAEGGLLVDGGNAAGLRVLKRRFDPDGVFASAIPLLEG
jgi:hypothetical protein